MPLFVGPIASISQKFDNVQAFCSFTSHCESRAACVISPVPAVSFITVLCTAITKARHEKLTRVRNAQQLNLPFWQQSVARENARR